LEDEEPKIIDNSLGQVEGGELPGSEGEQRRFLFGMKGKCFIEILSYM